MYVCCVWSRDLFPTTGLELGLSYDMAICRIASCHKQEEEQEEEEEIENCVSLDLVQKRREADDNFKFAKCIVKGITLFFLDVIGKI